MRTLDCRAQDRTLRRSEPKALTPTSLLAKMSDAKRWGTKLLLAARDLGTWREGQTHCTAARQEPGRFQEALESIVRLCEIALRSWPDRFGA